MLATIDTLEIHDRLKRAFSEEQAHELSQALTLIEGAMSESEEGSGSDRKGGEVREG